MHYYKRNLGDYAKKAGRLSILQHGVYNLLIDACYDREQFPTEEEAIDWVWASTEQEIEAVKFVLRKFFVLENGVFVQTRIVEELAEYKKKAETNARIATDREQKRTNRAPVVHETTKKQDAPSPNHKPITINQEPKEKTKTKSAEAIRPDDVPEKLWFDFLAVRKAKRAPLTESAIRLLTGEAQKAGLSVVAAIEVCVQQNWQNFKADWVKQNHSPQNQAPPKSFAELKTEANKKRIAEMTGGLMGLDDADDSANTIEGTYAAGAQPMAFIAH